MKRLWIKFEDTHGMFTVWNRLSRANLMEGFHTFTEVRQDLFVSNAIGNRWLQLKNSDVSFVKKQGLTDIVYIIDLDNTSGYKDKLLELKTLQKTRDRVVLPLSACGINVWFIPIVYAAESVLLLQYIREYSESIEGVGKFI